MKYKKLPDAAYLHECLRYAPVTGLLFWKLRPREHFDSRRICTWWNKRYAGKQAFVTVNNSGYFFAAVDNRKYLAHRVIWKLMTGEDPVEIVDHVDRNPLNNCWANLRCATKSQNNINRNKKAGVHFDKSRGNWQAYTKRNGRKVHLGRYASEAEARRARAIGVEKIYREYAP